MPSKNYLCIQRSQGGQCEPPSPENMQKMYESFHTWREKYQDNIHDLGGKLAQGGNMVTAEGITDGPFAETKEIIGGYMILSAESMEEASQIARESPDAGMPGTSIEVREISTS